MIYEEEEEERGGAADMIKEKEGGSWFTEFLALRSSAPKVWGPMM